MAQIFDEGCLVERIERFCRKDSIAAELRSMNESHAEVSPGDGVFDEASLSYSRCGPALRGKDRN